MALSYLLRLACVAIVASGMIVVAVELLLWVAAKPVLRLLTPLAARTRERVLYLVQLAPSLVAVALIASVCIPGYVRNETNLAAESVGWICLLLVAAVSAWFVRSALRGFGIVLRTALFTNAWKRSAAVNPQPMNQARFIPLVKAAHPVALVGLLHPRVFIAKHLLDEGTLSPVALDLILEHERSHAVQQDNWKLLSLYCMPRLGLTLPGGGTWLQHWQSAAEWAADDDAVRGDPQRALLLAETLVAFARNVASPAPALVSTAFVCGNTGLEKRVGRLIDLSPIALSATASTHPGQISAALTLAAMLIGGAAAIACATPWLHDLSEHLLHLG
jgi:beta-lactamase regulating signal transducer with metallopeptidase domain